MSPSAARAIRDHEVRGQEPPEGGAGVVAVQEVAPPAVIEVQHVDAEAVHLRLAFLDEALALPAQRGEIVGDSASSTTKEPSSRNRRRCSSTGPMIPR